MPFPKYETAPPLLVHGGPVRLMDGSGEMPEAVLVVGGKVVSHGAVRDLEAELGAGGRRIDTKGAAIVPGLIDTHPHLLHFAARSESFVDLSDAVDHDDIVRRIAAKAAETPPGEWIMTTPVGEPYYFIRRSYRDLKERVLPNRHVLDRATDRHPVYVQAWTPETPNVCVFNSLALKKLSLTDHIPDRVANVWLDKDDNGTLTGILRGSVNTLYCFDPFWIQIYSKIPYPSVNPLNTTRKAMADYNRLGVTTVYEAHNMTAEHVRVYRTLRETRELTVRVMAAMEIELYAMPPYQPKTVAQLYEALDTARALQVEGDDYLCVRGATLSDGGPCWTGHQRSFEPYRDPYGEPTKGTRFISQDKKRAFVHYCVEHGMRANFCSGSPGDHEDFLGVLEEAENAGSVSTKNWIVQHAAQISPRQTERFHRLGFDVTTSMSFPWGLGDITVERVGPHVRQDLVPLNRFLRLGMTVGAGSDWGPKNLFEHIKLAETHEFARSGYRNDGPDQKVTRDQAFAMWTREAAQVLRWQQLGTLAVGSHGDLAIVDRDPLTCALDDLPATEVLMTILGGQTVYDAGKL